MKLSALFSDSMVLQRDAKVPVWGWADFGETVIVEFAGQHVVATADAGGRWQATLAPMAASSEGRELVVRSERSRDEFRIADVLVGEVWIASGQSNMQWSVAMSAQPQEEIAAGDHPQIRLFTVPNLALTEPQHNVDAAWQVCSPSTVANFSGVAYFFARHLHRELNVPIGIINTSWGGTRAEAWTSREALMTLEETRREVERYENTTVDPKERAKWEEFARDVNAWERKYAAADPGNTGLAKDWASNDFDDSDWKQMPIPSGWQHHGLNFSGVLWFRREIDVPESMAGKDLILSIGACDKQDTTYFNNTQVGATGWETKDAWCKPRTYRVPGSLVRRGKNVIAVRVYSYLYQGGMIGPADIMYVTAEGSDQKLPISGKWRYQVEHNFGVQSTPQPALGPGNANTPYILYDSKITPLVPYAVRGFIWYQGESNADTSMRYRELFPLMIRDWRRTFAQGELPFVFVQLANYKAHQQWPSEGGWAQIRESQMMALREPKTAMAVTLDIGEANDIHPRNKQDVGKRLALGALKIAYGKEVAHSGPMYRSHTVEGDTIRLRFDHAEHLRSTDGGPLAGFAIAGSNSEFAWATATIDGDTIAVSSPAVKRPVAARYAWADNPKGNLTNASGIPASSFRTDAKG